MAGRNERRHLDPVIQRMKEDPSLRLIDVTNVIREYCREYAANPSTQSYQDAEARAIQYIKNALQQTINFEIRNATRTQLAMLGEILIYAFQENKMETDDPVTLKVELEKHDAWFLAKDSKCEAIAWSILSDEDKISTRAKAISRKGGKSTSTKKVVAAKANGKLGGRPKKK